MEMDNIVELGLGGLVDVSLDSYLGSDTHGWGLEGHVKA